MKDIYRTFKAVANKEKLDNISDIIIIACGIFCQEKSSVKIRHNLTHFFIYYRLI